MFANTQPQKSSSQKENKENNNHVSSVNCSQDISTRLSNLSLSFETPSTSTAKLEKATSKALDIKITNCPLNFDNVNFISFTTSSAKGNEVKPIEKKSKMLEFFSDENLKSCNRNSLEQKVTNSSVSNKAEYSNSINSKIATILVHNQNDNLFNWQNSASGKTTFKSVSSKPKKGVSCRRRLSNRSPSRTDGNVKTSPTRKSIRVASPTNANARSFKFTKGTRSIFSKSWLLSLQCQTCGNVLSVGPVLLQADGSNVCGRCPSPTDKAYRNFAYEKLALREVFPCIYAGCNDVIPWSEVRDHEQTCPHKPDTCPIDNCSWRRNKRFLNQHFKEDHKELYIEGDQEFELNLTENQNLLLLSYTLNTPLIIKIAYDIDAGSLKFYLYHLKENADKVGGIVEVRDNHKNVTEKFIKVIPEFGSDSLGIENAIIFNHIFSVINEFKAFCRFKVVTESKRYKSNGDKEYEKLKCCQCTNFVIDGFHLREAEIVCNRCKGICSSQSKYVTLNDYNNIPDEEFVPCGSQGCPFQIRKKNLKEHLLECDFKNWKCERCPFLGKFEDLKNHCIEKYFAIVGKEHTWKTTLNTSSEHVEMILNNDIFFFTRKTIVNPSAYYCTEFYVKRSSLTNDRKFVYKIQLINQEDDFFTLTLQGKEQQSGLIGNIFIEKDEDLKSFLHGEIDIEFRILLIANI